MVDSPTFPIEPHIFYPQYTAVNGQVAAGAVQGTGRVLEQPVAFPHYLHATTLEMSCEYCHSDARKSIHGGVPSTQVCMNCHNLVKTVAGADEPSPEIAKVVEAHNAGTPLVWNKVHDLPDYVVFAHSRHVNAGVQCTECHGQVQLQGQRELVKVARPSAEGAPHAAPAAEGEVAPHTEGQAAEGEGHGEMVEVEMVKNVMIREATLQMGWCLECHASHPSIDENYGERANVRRAELKDCWTCHK
ncbi:MAG: cytochrome c3 family protein [Deltaproteobacteria bacterium]|nr:cytochrome c3 family protein [Deltaproteobacteria bacterium]